MTLDQSEDADIWRGLFNVAWAKFRRSETFESRTQSLVALRSIATMVAETNTLSGEELGRIREFCRRAAYEMIDHEIISNNQIQIVTFH